MRHELRHLGCLNPEQESEPCRTLYLAPTPRPPQRSLSICLPCPTHLLRKPLLNTSAHCTKKLVRRLTYTSHSSLSTTSTRPPGKMRSSAPNAPPHLHLCSATGRYTSRSASSVAPHTPLLSHSCAPRLPHEDAQEGEANARRASPINAFLRLRRSASFRGSRQQHGKSA